MIAACVAVPVLAAGHAAQPRISDAACAAARTINASTTSAAVETGSDALGEYLELHGRAVDAQGGGLLLHPPRPRQPR